MDATRGSISSASTQSTRDESAASPFILCHGRRFLRDLPYPLPCDLPELQRQNLQTLLSISTIGTALGSPPSFLTRPPTKVLETACGSGYWSSLCHEHLEAAGHKGVSFTGLDVVDLAGNLERQGVDWKFVQHDVRKVPLPFDDEEFDIVVMKDMGLVVPMGALQQRIMEEITRVLKSGGTLEIWEKDVSIAVCI
jgi:SAM-dependent methyltransferase